MPDPTVPTRHKCFVCDKEIADRWFCRIPREGTAIVFCSPGCTLRYFESLRETVSRNGGR